MGSCTSSPPRDSREQKAAPGDNHEVKMSIHSDHPTTPDCISPGIRTMPEESLSSRLSDLTLTASSMLPPCPVGNGGESQDTAQTRSLLSSSFDKLSNFSFHGKLLKAKVVDIQSGHLVTLVFYWKGEAVKFPCRLHGIVCPAATGAKDKSDVHKVAAANHVCTQLRAQLLEQVEPSLVWVLFTDDTERRGGELSGYLYKVHPKNPRYYRGSEPCINAWLLSSKFAKESHGGEGVGGRQVTWTGRELQAILRRSP